ncbi:MAG: proline--tRNA ligase [Elusimicrobia bacterium CG1_02_63_36]|nr:MAG: proline--tRNA ligase [Elusimicrobia bacterium CG1_02_63_36]PIP82430.1 MAG: proline--tRNA ligase [Elusimicrobia bacterium CG22_combo_CG10-13_8_21_14_all_63_91]PJA17880.1 MAG: proline--tRNA ligase [Elusimicrobia bacterium CG_4_10_14_0_2_um_filter_63_34]PJB26578.1 MAG: proline--tRNA ligase [Elusimicrobia bacterium CG_4_9_14_3_um_filter_62_55]
MRLSSYLLPTLRQAPSDADNASAQLMQRAGMIRKVSSGIYDWLPMGLRALRKVEKVVREEMDRAGAQEVSLPVIQPKELWMETGRWPVYGKELLRIKDRKDAEFCFAPTAEEVITDLVRREVRSWRQLPLCLYQIGLKFRDEIRPRFGVMRAREFLMKDAYSFHADDEDASKYYEVMKAAYTRIFERFGLKFSAVEAQSGAIGGSFSHEFMVHADTGEETIVACADCGYAANIERAETQANPPEKSEFAPGELEEVETPGKTSVEDVAKFMKMNKKRFLKTQLYMAGGKPVMALVRGDHELNEAKLAGVLGGVEMHRASEEEYEIIAGCAVGFAGPVGLPRYKTREGTMEDVRILADYSVEGLVNAASGANKKDFHLKGINMGRDFAPEAVCDLRMTREDDPCPRCSGTNTKFTKGIEVGHVFKLGTKYSEKLKAEYLDAHQQSRTMVMGCYGIGVSRVVAAAIEQGHDDWGIIWPKEIAPFTAAVLCLDADDPAVKAEADKLYDACLAAGIDALYDDRDERPGVKFKDIDLIGIPFRVVVSKKTVAAGSVEFKRRASKETELWPLSEAFERLKAVLEN